MDVEEQVEEVVSYLTAEEEHVVELQKLLRIDPDDADTLFNLGNALDTVGRYSDAVTAYRLSLERSCNSEASAWAWLNLAGTLRALGHMGEAEQALRSGFGLLLGVGDSSPMDGAAVLASLVRLVKRDLRLEAMVANVAECARLRDLLLSINFFTPGAVAHRAGFGTACVATTGRALHKQRFAWAARCAAQDDLFDMLVRLLVIGCAAPVTDVQKVLGGINLELLLSLGLLVETMSGFLVGAAQLTPLPNGLVALADWQSDTLVPDASAVMAPGDDSLQLLYALRPEAVAGNCVLELCCGSGAAAAFAASLGAAQVVAVDINPRCCAFASCTAALNGLRDRVEVLEGDLYSSVTGRKFGLILANPPFVAAPAEGPELSLYAGGGPDGLRVTRELLTGAAAALDESGRIVIIAELPNLPMPDASGAAPAPAWTVLHLQSLSLTAVYAPEHTQTAEEYAVCRGLPAHTAQAAWAGAMRAAGAVTMTDALLVGQKRSPGTWKVAAWSGSGVESWLEDPTAAAKVQLAMASALLPAAVLASEDLPTNVLPASWGANGYARDDAQKADVLTIPRD